MAEIFMGSSLFALLLTLGMFQVGRWIQAKTGSALCNPILISTLLIIALLVGFGIPNEYYQANVGGISWLLTPATVCLAVPLYQQLQALKNNLKAIVAGVVAGTVTCLLFITVMSAVFRLDTVLKASILPKSITTAMGLALSQQLGGIPSITSTCIMITGMLGSIAGSSFCKLFHITHPIAQGAALGTASHVIGTSRASQLSPLAGAVSSLSLVVAGILTAILCPLVV